MPTKLATAYNSATRNIQWVGNNLVLTGVGLARPIKLLRSGALTHAGNRLAALGWAPPAEVAHARMPTTLRGKREYVTLPSGREAMTRRGHGVRKFTKRADTEQGHGGAQRGKKMPELVRGAAGTAQRIWDDYVAEWAEYSALGCQNILITDNMVSDTCEMSAKIGTNI